MMSGPVLITCLQRENSVKHLLDILGPHDPRAARQESQFLLRGCFGVDEVQNGLYGEITFRMIFENSVFVFRLRMMTIVFKAICLTQYVTFLTFC